MKKSKMIYANIALLIAAAIWGFAFVAQSVAMDYVGPFTFQSVRSILGGVTLLPLVLVYLWKYRGENRARNPEMNKNVGIEPNPEIKQNAEIKQPEKQSSSLKLLLQGGVVCGVILCVASCFQQIGIQYTTAGKAGFLTSMYLVIVPIFSIFLRKRVTRRQWSSVALAMMGAYLLSVTEELRLSAGDAYVLVCALCFAVHILAVDYYAPRVNGVCLSCIQFFVSGILAAVPMGMFEQPTLAVIWSAAVPILYAGVMSCGVAYTFQILGQKYAQPVTATLLMSLESVFSLIGGILILHQIPTGREVAGCVLMFCAILLSQLYTKSESV